MVASQLRRGMAIRFEGHLYKVLSADYHPGQGQMGGATHAHLQDLDTGTFKDHNFRAALNLDDVPLEKVPMGFLYRDGDHCVFMNPDTFEQVELHVDLIGPQERFLVEEMRVTVESVEGSPVGVQFPDFIEVAVRETTPPVHGQGDNTRKQATLANDVEVMVPQFIKIGDVIRLDLNKIEYMDRVSAAG